MNCDNLSIDIIFSFGNNFILYVNDIVDRDESTIGSFCLSWYKTKW
jgi:hypothetical protein